MDHRSENSGEVDLSDNKSSPDESEEEATDFERPSTDRKSDVSRPTGRPIVKSKSTSNSKRNDVNSTSEEKDEDTKGDKSSSSDGRAKSNGDASSSNDENNSSNRPPRPNKNSDDEKSSDAKRSSERKVRFKDGKPPADGKVKYGEFLGPSQSKTKLVRLRKVSDSSLFWWLLAIARLYLASVQTGYIHPDEFHQSVQVMAGDILDIEAPKPWEFHTSAPIRSITFSAVVSLPYVILRYLAPLVSYYFDVELLTPQVLLVAPRVFMTLLSFIADYCIYRIACMCYLRPWSCVEIFASSYVMLVYGTRTFSNTIELILMAILLWRVCESLVDSTKIMRKESILQDLYEASDTVKAKVKFARMKSKLPPYNYVDSAIISVVVTYGTFVRPTFLIYSFVPVSYWLQRGVVTKEVDFSYFHLRCLSLLPGVFITFVTCVLADSFYYESVSFEELVYWNVTAHSFIVTPVNFFLYNSKTANLMNHGIHPYYLHLAVNIPILHGVLGILGLWTVSKYVTSFISNDIVRKPKVFSMATMLLISFIMPVIFLSTFPHQEPRFLLPTLLPLVILHSDNIQLYSKNKRKFTGHVPFVMWHVWNIFCVVIFGFLHQGGVTKTMISVYEHIARQPPDTNVHIVFANMYSPPTFLLMRKMKVIATTEDGHRYRRAKSVFTYDAGGSKPVEFLYDFTGSVYLQATANSTTKMDILICLPASLTDELIETKPENVTLHRIKRVPGHLTLENPPNLNLEGVKLTKSCGKACQILHRLGQFSIDILEIKFGEDYVNELRNAREEAKQSYFDDDEENEIDTS
ncbi:GPI mannosyltransferase 4-like [Macrobrachium nipponense]|uniref:GPI mannosyltransferase 4-like n=1 Tax=Macrobrachium nipponense TaxID=159736 RepID=UPI0030C8972A